MLAVFLDTETTGLDPFSHVPIEIACVLVDLSTGNELVSYEKVIQITDQEWEKHDPHSLFINGIEKSELDEGSSTEEVRLDIERIFEKHGVVDNTAFFICQNPAFDRTFFAKIVPVYIQEQLHWPYHWLDLASMYWALKSVYVQKSGKNIHLSKDAIAHSLGLDPELKPHRAMNGARHLLCCYRKLVGFLVDGT